jgi:hypothetical protein
MLAIIRCRIFSSLLSKNAVIKVYRTLILTGMYRCETWSITLREERWLRVLRVFGCKRDEVMGVEKINRSCSLAQYCSGDKIEKNEMGHSM